MTAVHDVRRTSLPRESATVVRDAMRHARSRRWGLVTAGIGTLVYSLVAGAGLVQYAPNGWVVPLRTWMFHRRPTPYWFYAFDEHWGIVPVPWYVARAAFVAALLGLFVALVVYERICCRSRRTDRGRGLAGVGALTAVVGMASCCSPLALALTGVVGYAAVAFFADHGLLIAFATLVPAVAWQVARLVRADRAPARPAGERPWPTTP